MKKYVSLSLLFLGIASLKGMEEGQSQPEEVSQEELKVQFEAAKKEVAYLKTVHAVWQSALDESVIELGAVGKKYGLLLTMIEQSNSNPKFNRENGEANWGMNDELTSPRLKKAFDFLLLHKDRLRLKEAEYRNVRNALVGAAAGLVAGYLLGKK